MGSARLFSDMAPIECLREWEEAMSELHSVRLSVTCSVGGGLFRFVPLLVRQEESLKSWVLETLSVRIEVLPPPLYPMFIVPVVVVGYA
jgi:hypothetical protein